MNIPLGYEIGTGRQIEVPLAHTAVTGQTQASGKTTTLEALIHRSGRRAVAFLTKRGEGAFQTSTPVPPYFSEATDWEYVKEMLESQARTKLKFETSWIIEVSKGTKTLADVKRNVEAALNGIPNPNPPKKGARGKAGTEDKARWIRRPASGLSQGVYTVLNAYLEKLLPQIEKLKYERTLDLKPGLNVMDLTAYTLEMQGLVVRSVLQWVYEHERNVIVIIPEAWELLPQDRGSPVRLAAENYIRKGAVLGNYLWLDSQDIAGVNKAILRQVGVWIIGVQREANEVMRTLKQFISQPARPKPDDLMTLGKGQFLVAYDISQFRVYVQPRWMGDVHAKSIATGEEKIESAGSVYRTYLANFKTDRARDTRNAESYSRQEFENDQMGQTGTDNARKTMERHPEQSARGRSYLRPRFQWEPDVPLATGANELDAQYNYFRTRILKDPAVLAVLREGKTLEVVEKIQTIELDATDAAGAVASLVEEGFFREPRNGYAVFKELVERRRKSFARATIYDACDKIAGYGFLLKERAGYVAIPGVQIRRRTA